MTLEEFMICYSGKDIWRGLLRTAAEELHPDAGKDETEAPAVDLPLFLWVICRIPLLSRHL